MGACILPQTHTSFVILVSQPLSHRAQCELPKPRTPVVCDESSFSKGSISTFSRMGGAVYKLDFDGKPAALTATFNELLPRVESDEQEL